MGTVSDKYVLFGKLPVLEPDLDKWARWYENSFEERRVARTDIGDITVSTVFLGLDHAFGGGAPLLFETMIRSNGSWDNERRCTTWAEAEEQHKAACAEVAMTKEED